MIKFFLFFLFALTLTGAILLGLTWYSSYGYNQPHVSKTSVILPVLSNTPFPTKPVLQPDYTFVQSSKIENAIGTIVFSYPQLKFGVSFIDLKSGEKADVNGNQIFDGASTTKVFIACLLLSQVEAGKYNLEKNLNGVTLKQLLQQMINRSDNDAWVALMNFIGFQYQRPYAKSIGISSYNVANNKINSNDMALLLEELYTGKLLNTQDTNLLLSYMQHTNNDDLIPPAVPDGILVYHKYGSFNGYLDDVAIVDNGEKPFVLAIFSSTGSGDLTYAKKVTVFHDIVTAVENADSLKTNIATP